MATRQELGAQQKSVFSQALRQTIQILELSILELKETVEAELINNPVIEETQKDLPSPSAAPEENPSEEAPFDSDTEVLPEKPSPDSFLPGKGESLSDHLLRQLRINAADENQIKIGTAIIQCLDENGYLAADFSSLASNIPCSEKELQETLDLIQTFEPAGVASRDLRECLEIQLRRIGGQNSLAADIIQSHLHDLTTQEPEKLYRRLKCTREEFAQAVKKIQALEPKPGRRYIHEEILYVFPDAVIEEHNNDLIVTIKKDTIPTIRINTTYKNMLRSKSVDEATKSFIRQKILEANRLITAIHQRGETLAKIIAKIAQAQKEALLKGRDHLTPLTLAQIAREVNMHESTISRVVMNKYVQTPIGILRLKDLFSGNLKTADGEPIASQNIKCAVQELIAAEDKNAPLGDNEIAERLRDAENVAISRRTIAKYRQRLKIPPAHKRRHSFTVNPSPNQKSCE